MAMSRSSRLIVSALLCLAVAAGLQGGCVAADEAEAAAESGPYAPPAFKGTATLLETFQDDVFEAKRAYKSTESNYVGQTMELGEATDDGALAAGIKGDNGLVLTKAAQRYGVLLPYADGASAVIEAGADAEGEAGAAFVLQYEVRLSQGLDCGGAYVKVLEDRDDLDATALKDDTPYIIMFGPDKCGATNKVHFILRHRNPVNGEWSEHHLASPPTPKTDRNSHLYTLVVRRDNSFEILIDAKSVKAGSLLEDLEPPVNPPEEIDDPDDEKPADWVDEAKIKDPEAKKPDDWDEDAPKKIEDPEAVKPDDWLDDEPAFVPDPDAAMPDDWDEDEDGEWEAPSVANPKCEAVSGCGEWKRPVIANPAYKGKWTAPMIDNPEYKGVWEPRKIPNPAHFVDEHPAALPKTAAVAVEIWTMSAGIAFDNILVTDDEEAAADYAEATWAVKHARQESEAKEAKRAKDRAEREKKLAEGGFMNTFNYYLVELTEAAVDNPVISISCIVVAVIAIFYGCLRMAGGDDDDMPIRPTSAADVAATAPGPAADDGKAGAAGKAEGTAAADAGADDAADADADADAGDADASGSGSEAEATEGKAEGETPGGSVRQRHKGKPSRRRTPKTGD